MSMDGNEQHQRTAGYRAGRHDGRATVATVELKIAQERQFNLQNRTSPLSSIMRGKGKLSSRGSS